MIRDYFAGRTILITGCTGYLGKSLLEKILRDLPEIGRVNVAIRASSRRSAQDRLERDILTSPVFNRLKRELGEEQFSALAHDRLRVVEIDLGRDRLGLTDQGRAELQRCTVVIHSAAAVEFDNPADQSAQTNLLGATRLVRELVASPAQPHLVHVSTAYVGSMLRGVVREEPPHDPGLNWRTEAEVMVGLRPLVEEESRRPENLARFRKEAEQRMGPAGTRALGRATERNRQRWVKEQLVVRGRAHARALGFSDIYSFTKSMAERAVIELHDRLPVSICRPSIVESALRDPHPGWLEGFRMAEPILLAFGRNAIDDFPGLPEGVLDMIPIDFVVNAVLAAAANPPEPGGIEIYQVASGSRNPLRLRDIQAHGRAYFGEHPLRDRYGQAIRLPEWKFPPVEDALARVRTMQRVVGGAQWVASRLPLTKDTLTELSDNLAEQRERIDRAVDLIELYGVYTSTDCIFDTSNLMRLRDRLSEADRTTFEFDAANLDWGHYLREVHLPTVIRMSRAETYQPGRGRASGSTAPKPAGGSGRQFVNRRAGEPGVVAVFDVDGTLLDTDVVAYYVWMRLRDRPIERWPGLVAGLLAKVPGWLVLDSRDRAGFQRSFFQEYAGLEEAEVRRLGREALHHVTLRRSFPAGLRRVREHKEAGHRVLILTGAHDAVVEPLAELLEVDYEAMRLEVEDGYYTGRLLTPPAVAEARATLLEEYCRRHGCDPRRGYAYADSISDLPMLEAVATPVAVNPDPRLSHIAGQRGWRVEQWRKSEDELPVPFPDPRVARDAARREARRPAAGRALSGELVD